MIPRQERAFIDQFIELTSISASSTNTIIPLLPLTPPTHSSLCASELASYSKTWGIINESKAMLSMCQPATPPTPSLHVVQASPRYAESGRVSLQSINQSIMFRHMYNLISYLLSFIMFSFVVSNLATGARPQARRRTGFAPSAYMRLRSCCTLLSSMSSLLELKDTRLQQERR